MWRQILCVGIFLILIGKKCQIVMNLKDSVCSNFVCWCFHSFKSFDTFCVRTLMNLIEGVAPNFVCRYFCLFGSSDSFLYISYIFWCVCLWRRWTPPSWLRSTTRLSRVTILLNLACRYVSVVREPPPRL